MRAVRRRDRRCWIKLRWNALHWMTGTVQHKPEDELSTRALKSPGLFFPNASLSAQSQTYPPNHLANDARRRISTFPTPFLPHPYTSHETHSLLGGTSGTNPSLNCPCSLT